MHTKNKISSDLLIIGGGLAGLFAAIKAKKEGVDVVLVDKGYAGNSGQSPYTDSFCPYNKDWGHDIDMWVDEVSKEGEYVNNKLWTKKMLEGSFEAYEQMVGLGVEFYKGSDGTITLKGDVGGPGPQTMFYPKNVAPKAARKEAVRLGVKIYDRLMIAELVKKDEKVIGAMGICAEEANLYIFSAKATIMCAGAVGFKPDGWPIHELTGDSDAMAYRVGAQVLGKEFIDSHVAAGDNPAYMPFAEIIASDKPNMGPPKRPKDMKKPKYDRDGLWLSEDFEAHEGRGPVLRPGPGGFQKARGGTSLGMACHKTEGIVANDDLTCATQIDGLFAAGDALGNMAAGSNYPFMGFAVTHACVTGNLSAENAVKYIAGEKEQLIDDEKIAEIEVKLYEPLNRTGGYEPRWVNQVLKNTLTPYFILYVKHEERLKGALAYIEFLSSHVLPMLYATDAHELRMAHETKNMVLNAEMKLRSAMERKESRGSHYREDYPKRNNDYLAWIKLGDVDGKMDVCVDPIPKELLPDLSLPYEELYPLRLPKEFD